MGLPEAHWLHPHALSGPEFCLIQALTFTIEKVLFKWFRFTKILLPIQCYCYLFLIFNLNLLLGFIFLF